MEKSKYIDLHIHTNRSDGSDFVEDCIKKAVDSELSAIAITDHNCFDAVEDAICIGEEYGLEVIPAIEIDADYTHSFHFIAYFTHDGFLRLQAYFNSLKNTNTAITVKNFIKSLKKNGYKIEIPKNKKHLKVYDILCALCENGYFETPYQAERELISGPKRIFAQDAFTLQEIIDKVHSSNGIIIWAHPFGNRVRLSKEDIAEQVITLKQMGIDGIEALHFSADMENTKFLIELAKENKMIVTGGSDYHGAYRPEISIGAVGNFRVPYSILQSVKNKIASY